FCFQVSGFCWIATKWLQSSYLDLRERTGKENCAGISPSSLTYQKDCVLPALELSSNPSEIILAVNWLLVDFEDDITAAEPNIFCERSLFYIADDHTLVSRNAKPVCDV